LFFPETNLVYLERVRTHRRDMTKYAQEPLAIVSHLHTMGGLLQRLDPKVSARHRTQIHTKSRQMQKRLGPRKATPEEACTEATFYVMRTHSPRRERERARARARERERERGKERRTGRGEEAEDSSEPVNDRRTHTHTHNHTHKQDALSPFWYVMRLTGPGSAQSVYSKGECWYDTHIA